MRRIDESNARCTVFTEREGPLARLGHDLAIEVSRFAIEIDEETGQLEGTFQPDSLRVIGPVEGGEPSEKPLRSSDQKKIERTIQKEILQIGRHGPIRFVVEEGGAMPGQGGAIHGELELRGVRRPLSAELSRVDKGWRAEAAIHQPDFGIEPYRAMMGSLRVKPVVRVVVELKAESFAAPAGIE